MIPQRTEEWHSLRVGRITGSRAAVALEISPYSKPDDLIREMVREYHGYMREFQGNEATQWGTDHEIDGINWLESENSIIVQEHGLQVHPEHDWIGYSPDGTAGDSLVEIKCPYSKKIPNEVPEHYIAQVQLGMEVMSLEECQFLYWTPNAQRLFTVKRDPTWFELNFDDLFRFHQRYIDELDNPAHLEPLVTDMTADKDWAELERQYLITKKEADTIASQLEKIKSEMILKAGKGSAKGSRYQLIKSVRPGSVSNKDLYREFGISEKILDKFRGKATEYYSVKEVKNVR